MKRHMFLLAGGAAALAGCSHHGGLIPSLGPQKGPGGGGADYLPASVLPTQPIVGEVRRFDGAAAPRGWAFCDGATLQVRNYPSLFAVLGKSAGGDGITTFKLPKSAKFTFVIAVSGASPQNPKQLRDILVRRPNGAVPFEATVRSI